MTVEITTNNHEREVLDERHLTPAEREWFDYIDWDAVEDGRDSVSFFRYRGDLYDLHDNEGRLPVESELSAWDGYYSGSFFSGVVFRYARDDRGEIVPEYVIVGSYYFH